MTESEVAKQLGVPIATVRWWRHRQQLPYAKLGRHIRIRAADLDVFIQSRMRPKEAAPQD